MATTLTVHEDHLHDYFVQEYGERYNDQSIVGKTVTVAPRDGVDYPDTVTDKTEGAERFRLFDDDRQLYYSGWFVGDWEDVMDWGMWAGCTYVTDGHGRIIIG